MRNCRPAQCVLALSHCRSSIIRLVVFCSSQRSRQSNLKSKASDAAKAHSSGDKNDKNDRNDRNDRNDKNESADRKEPSEVPDNKIQKSVPRNRELERLGVIGPIQHVSDTRRQCVTKKSDNGKSTVVPNSHAKPCDDHKTDVTDVDESSSSETDIDESVISDEDSFDHIETDEAMSDSEVIIVSEVRGKKPSFIESKPGNDGSKATTRASVPLKKSSVQETRMAALRQPSSSSQWMHRVTVLEATMTEMKGKFADILRQKVRMNSLTLLYSRARQ